MTSQLRYIVLTITLLCSILSATAFNAVADSTDVSRAELDYWLKEFGKEVVDTLNETTTTVDTIKEDDRLNYLFKSFGSEVLDTLNSAEVSKDIEDTKNIIDEKLDYLLKGFGSEILDTLNGVEVSKTLEETKKVIDDKLGYLLKGFGSEVLDTLSKKDGTDINKDSLVLNSKLDFLLKEFGAEVLDTLSKSKEGEAKVGKVVNLAAKILEMYGDSIDSNVDNIEVHVEKLIKKVEPILLDTVNVKDLLNSVDSIIQEQEMNTVNPIFMDWVLGAPDAVSLSLSDEDSIIVDVRNHVKDYIRTTSPELYSYHISELPKITDLKGSRLENIGTDNLRLDIGSANAMDNKLNVTLPKVSKWSLGAKFQVHASQNYISPNWYKGGESNVSVQSYAIGYFKYDNKSGLQWDSKVEWKLGVNSSGSDTLRWLRVNEDLFRINSKVGFKAFKDFYYTAELDFQTQFFNTYKANSNIRTSGPFSPIRNSFSIGMDYKYKDMISLFVSPISYKYVFVADTTCKEGVEISDNIPNQVGLKDGSRKSHQLGALIRLDFEHDFNESIGMEVKFNFFGNYVGRIKGIEIGCEVIGNFKINRFLTARAILYPRYDSTVIPADGGKPKLQFWELISLGFTYKI